MRATFQNFVDPRTGKNKMYSMVDAVNIFLELVPVEFGNEKTRD